jgi:hypothetical protein
VNDRIQAAAAAESKARLMAARCSSAEAKLAAAETVHPLLSCLASCLAAQFESLLSLHLLSSQLL